MDRFDFKDLDESKMAERKETVLVDALDGELTGYIFKLADHVSKQSGKPMVKASILLSNDTNHCFTELYLSADPKMAYRLKGLLIAIGRKDLWEKRGFEHSDLLKKRFDCTAEKEKYINNQGEEKQRSAIKKFIEPAPVKYDDDIPF